MMPNITRGDRMAGLMVYLVGPGRANEHEDQHLVAGDGPLLAWHDDNELSRDSALDIARHLDRPRKALGVEVARGHVWHCSLSLSPEEGELSDEQWRDIAEDFIAQMEFDDNEGTKAPCRWAAVRHGLSKNGGDHIHLAVNLVREDGTKAVVHEDFRRAQQAARELEKRHGLVQLESAQAQRATRGYKPGEREAQARRTARGRYESQRRQSGEAMPPWARLSSQERRRRVQEEMRRDHPRHALATRVRGAAAAAGDEAEFVRRMRGTGLLVRPRFADGRTDVVTGFSVAERPRRGERPIWYGGGRLARDLTLPRLRAEQGWPDTPTGASAAAEEWTAAKRQRRIARPGREAAAPDPQQWQALTSELDQLSRRLGSIGIDDRDAWAGVAREGAGVLAAWSNAVEDEPGELAAASEALSRSGQTYRHTPTPQQNGNRSLSKTAGVLTAASAGQGRMGQAVLIRQLLRTAQAVHDHAAATGQARQARTLARTTRAQLVHVRAQLPTPSTVAPQRQGVDEQGQAAREAAQVSQPRAARQMGSPIPSKITPTAQRARPQSPTVDAQKGEDRDGRA